MSSSALRRYAPGRGLAAYGAISAAALLVDLIILDRLLLAGLSGALAAAAGYSAGIGVHWTLSARTVFAAAARRRGSAGRLRQKLLFLMSAMAGLAITMAVVGAGTALGFDARTAKLVAIGVSFFAVWLVRRLYIFAA